jgi:cold shock CspA family protein
MAFAGPAASEGRVARFDVEVGLGTVRGDDGRDYPFHCTQIADGSRTIDEGARVSFAVVAGHGGRWEATVVRPC